MNTDWNDLLQRTISGLASEDEQKLLAAELEANEALADLYVRCIALEVALETKAASQESARELITAPVLKPKLAWFSWRPLSTASAAGLVLGIFGASLVLGFADDQHVAKQTLLHESFEDAALPRESGLPTRADIWAGDLLEPRTATERVKPANGEHMITLPQVTKEKRRLSYAFHFIDVSGLPRPTSGRTRQIEVTAKFHCELPGIKDRLQVKLAAFDVAVAEARDIWLNGDTDELALMDVTKTVKTDPAKFGWTSVRTAIDLPADAQVLLLCFAAGVAHGDKSKVDHFLDDVEVRLITSDLAQP